jgi:hypothetical protein
LKRLIYIIIFLAVLYPPISGQGTDRNRLLQVSGIITDDEKHPVAHVSVISTRLRRGTVSEMTGIYSLISVPGDTVFVSALGYKRMIFQVPAGFGERIYKKDLSLVSDTISIAGVNIFPWKTYEQFKQDVLAHQPKMKPEIKNMYDNLEAIRYYIANTPAYNVSPEAGYRMAMQQHVDRYVVNNQLPVNNLLNPIAWSKFLSGVKSGLLKNQKTAETTKAKKIKPKKNKSQENNDQKK